MSAACHRSLYGYQLRTALALAVENPHIAVTFLPLACTRRDDRERAVRLAARQRMRRARGRCSGSVPAQIDAVAGHARQGAQAAPSRKLDLVLLTVGANDIKFSGLVADVIISAGVERTLFNQGGQHRDGRRRRRRSSTANCPANFAKLRAALKPLVGGNLSRVVYVSYGHPALQATRACPGGATASTSIRRSPPTPTRMQNVTEFVLRKFLPTLKALARCEAGTDLRATRRPTA